MPRKHFQNVRARRTASFAEGDSDSAPKRENPHFTKASFFRVIPALLAGALFAGAASVLASTTIGTNINTAGTLTITSSTATSTLSTGGLTIGTNQFVVQQTSGNVGIGTTSPWGFLSINPNVIGTGPEFVVGSSTATSFIVTNGGQLGIGTTSPGTFNTSGIPAQVAIDGNGGNNRDQLIINRGPGSSQFFTFAEDSTGHQFTAASPSSNTKMLILQSRAFDDGSSSGNPVGIVFQMAEDRAGSINKGEVARFTREGYLGIGTTSPYAILSVTNSGSTATTTMALRPISGQTANILDIYNTNGTLGTVINSSGNMGIGSTTPTQVLSVTGNGMFGSTATTTLYLQSTVANKGGCIQLMGANGTSQFRAYATTTGPMILESGTCQ